MFFGKKNLHLSRRRSQGKNPRSRSHHLARLALRSLSHEALEAREVLAATWEAMGPAPVINGGTDKVSPNNEVSGAIHVVLPHPTDANILYAGSVNGGIWRTDNAQAVSPTWVPLTNDTPSASIGAMAMDPTNPLRIVAGFGRYSASRGSGSLDGLLLTEDGGATWRTIQDPLLVGRNISGLAVNGDRIIVAAGGGFHGLSDPYPEGGLFRSTNGGATWTQIGVIPPDRNFPDEIVPFQAFDLVADPTDRNRFYVGVGRFGVHPIAGDAGGDGFQFYVGNAFEGIFRTDDGGATWTNITQRDPRITLVRQALINSRLDQNNVEMAVSRNGRLYAAIIAVGMPFYFGYTDTQGGVWLEMDLPQTQEANGNFGISPSQVPGGQGNIHFSVVADPVDPNTVYVGGDRQEGDMSFIFGNSIGARSFTGKLFRGDTRQPSILNVLDPTTGQIAFNDYSPQWEHLTHSNLVAQMKEGGTRRGSAPHADSRDMAFDAAGNLIEGDDGGIYRRTLPRSNQGDWYSINGNLQVTEIHDIAYDSVSNVLVGGTQDNATIMQTAPNSLVWQAVPLDLQSIENVLGRNAPGDGGDVVVDDMSDPNYSFRYMSSQSFLGFRRLTFNAKNELVDEKLITTPTATYPFVTPLVLNRVDPKRLVVGTLSGIAESPNRGEFFYAIPGPGQEVVGMQSGFTAMVAGGRRNGADNADILWVGSGAEIFVRVDMVNGLRATQSQFPGGFIRDLALDRQDWHNAYVIDRDDIYVTGNIGAAWTNITGNLRELAQGELRSLEFINGPSGKGYVVLGSDTGVFVMSEAAPGKWVELGDMPTVPVFEMDLDLRDNVLAAGTKGRGAFLIRDAAQTIEQVGLQNVDPVVSPNTPSTTTGYVWNDLDGDGVKDDNEPGVAGITVYVDRNGDNLDGLLEPAALTNVGGGYQILNVPSGDFAVRLALNPGWSQTFPTSGEHLIRTTAGSVINNLTFGIRSGTGLNTGFDYGDAPASFATSSAQNGPSHGIVAGFQLGATVDGELDGVPSANADSDGSDEDGVAISGDLISGTNVTINVSVQNGTYPKGLLQGWIDFDGDGRWTTPGEQIFTDQEVVAGVNSFVVAVPVWAKTGTSVARFRYGYERGLSYTGRAIAGEVEDYAFSVVKGGPTANDDSGYEVRRNSDDNFLAVLANDERRPNAGTVISEFSQGSSGGAVSLAPGGAGLLYSPATNFVGDETFTYTLRDNNGVTDSATVTVTVLPDLASLRLAVTDTNGNPINSIGTNQNFQLRGFVQDLTPTAGGVFAAYMDIEYPGAAASVVGTIEYGDDFPNGQSGITTVAGVIDEIGAFDGIDRLGASEGLLFIVPMRASRTGIITFAANPADNLPQHNVLLFDRNDPVPTSEIEYGSISITVTGTPAAARTNPTNSLDVNNDATISPIDALLVINELNRSFAAEAEGEGNPYYLDASADGAISPLDALLIINELNRPSRRAAVAASSTAPFAAALAAIPAGVTTADAEGEPVDLVAADVTASYPVAVELASTESIFQELAAASLDGSDDENWDELFATLEG